MSGALNRVKEKIISMSRYHVGAEGRMHWFVRSVDAWFPLSSGANILDAGCGMGRHVFYLAGKYPTFNIEGMDIDKVAIAVCNQIKAEAGYENCHFTVGDLAGGCGLRENYYDVVYCLDALIYVDDDRLALRDITRALRPGGIILVHVPLAQRKSYLKKSRQLDTVHDAVRDGYDRDQFIDLLHHSGLEILETYITFGKCGGLAWELWKINASKGIFRLVLKPLIMLLLRLDPHIHNREGRGILVIAKKFNVHLEC